MVIKEDLMKVRNHNLGVKVKEFLVTYEDGSVDTKYLPKLYMVYSLQRRMIRYCEVFDEPRPSKIIKVEEINDK